MLDRRAFLAGAAGALIGAGCATPRPDRIPIVDAHVHFYDPSRPEGVPWPDKDDPILHRPVLPPEYLALAKPLGIVGAVVVEASPRVEDNQWVLDLAKNEPFLLALVGHLKPGSDDFARDLERFAQNRRFAGIRAGGWNIPVAPENTAFLRDIVRLAERGLTLEVLAGPEQLPAVARIAEILPGLPIVIDHCAEVRIDGQAPDPVWARNIQAIAANRNVCMKVSGLPENTGRPGNAPSDPEFYRPVLDPLWNNFGAERLLFGSNWPVSSRFAPVYQILDIVRPYFAEKGAAASRKYFHENARRVYRLS